MPFTPDAIGYLIGIGMLAFVGVQILFYFYGVTRQLAYERRSARIRIETLNEELEIVRRRRRATPKSDASWQGYRRFVIKSIVRESSNARSIYLVPLDRRPLPSYFPGQFLTMRIDSPKEAEPLVRCYSLSDRPRQEYFRCTIKAIRGKPEQGMPHGKASCFINDTVEEGAVVEIQAPTGDFAMDLFERRPAVLLAGGIGITPLMSMIQTVAHEQTGRQIILFYGVRNSREHVFRKELSEITEAYPNIKVVTCYSSPLKEDRAKRDYDLKGRVTPEILKEILPANNFEFYLCGPSQFMDSLHEGLSEWGVPKVRIHSEAFGPAAVKNVNQAADAAKSQVGTTIRLARSGKQIVWTDDDKSILDCAERQGVALKASCRQGNCGTCAVALRSGQVDYAKQPSFDPGEGFCLTCQGCPKGEIEIDG